MNYVISCKHVYVFDIIVSERSLLNKHTRILIRRLMLKGVSMGKSHIIGRSYELLQALLEGCRALGSLLLSRIPMISHLHCESILLTAYPHPPFQNYLFHLVKYASTPLQRWCFQNLHIMDGIVLKMIFLRFNKFVIRNIVLLS